ncbi:hypothetical protein MRY87_08680 [bacterium]|nr:hypothetical protein [bacterium]
MHPDPQRKSSGHGASSDGERLGHELLEQRVRAIPRLLEEYLDQKPPRIQEFVCGNIVTTGIGSSEAHARYLAMLLNTIPGNQARFQPTVPGEPPASEEYSCVFSQGFSPNMRRRVEALCEHGSGVVITGLPRESEGAERRELLDRCHRNEIPVFHIPPAGEDETLIRMVGPWFGYLAAYQIASQLGEEFFPGIEKEVLLQMLTGAEAKADSICNQGLTIDKLFSSGATNIVLTLNSERWHGEHLSMKMHEGLFLPKPQAETFITFGHGPFQVIAKNGGTGILLRTTQQEEDRRAASIIASFSDISTPLFEVISDLPPVLAPLEWEQVMNFVVLRLMKERGDAADQRNFQRPATYDLTE